ncbi:MAG: hypothetical protein JXA37_09365 [Chloroflexia bacterium]|nr:hypothetical protein [Chloroflexia bacterium]
MPGTCVCGAAFFSPAEGAEKLGLHPSRVRAILARRPGRLGALRLGRGGWILPGESLERFRPNPAGVPLAERPEADPSPAICPNCGARLYTPAEVAAELGQRPPEIYALLSRRPHLLQAFRVGWHWVIPAAGLEAYRRQHQQIRAAQARLLELTTGSRPRYWTTRELAAEASRLGQSISLRKVQRFCQEGHIPAERPGRDYIITDAAARTFLQQWMGGEEADQSAG